MLFPIFINEKITEKNNKPIIIYKEAIINFLFAFCTFFSFLLSIIKALEIGRSGKILKDNFAIINTQLQKIDINPSFRYNEKALLDFI